MFLPIFIAILLGLISPNHQNTGCTQGTVQVNSTNDETGGSSGENGQVPPPKIEGEDQD